MDSQQTHSSYTQSTQSATTISTPTSYTESSNCENEPWGRLVVLKTSVRNLGVRKQPLFKVEEPSDCQKFDLAGPIFKVGRAPSNNLCCTSLNIEPKILEQFSGTHFKLSKEINDSHSPVFIEDLSKNGTYVNSDSEILGSKRILLHNDVIYVGKVLRVAFKFTSVRHLNTYLPQKIIEQFHIGRALGEGAFGTVYSVHDILTCERFAMKFVRKKLDFDNQQMETASNEANILRPLQHSCIIQMHRVISCFEEGIGILLDFMAGGDLHTRITHNDFLTEDNAKFFFYQICTGVKYLHDHQVAHRDLKPENILLASNEKNTLVKITDFGLSKMTNNNTMLHTVCGTPMFVAPEILEEKDPYTHKVDIWSLGIVLSFALSGSFPSDSANVTFEPNPRNNVTTTAKNLMMKMLSVDPIYRPSIDEVLADAWMHDKKMTDSANAVMSTSADADFRSRSPLII